MNVELSLNWGTYAGEVTKVEQNLNQYYRKPHDVEMINYDLDEKIGWVYKGDGYHSGPVRGTVVNNPENPLKKGMPEVYRVYPQHQTPLNCDWQWFWRELNPELTDKSFCTLLGGGLAWMNNTGFPGRKNCILQEDTEQKYPAFHSPIINGGATLKGVERNGYLLIDGLLTSETIPDPMQTIEKFWLWYWGTTVTKTGRVNYIVRLAKNGSYIPVRIPILSRYQLYAPLNWFDKLPIGNPTIPATSFS